MTCISPFVPQDANSFLKFPRDVVTAEGPSVDGKQRLIFCFRESCKDLIAHASSLAAEIVNVTPRRNGSVLQEGITRKSRSSERDTEPQVKFQELKLFSTLS